MQTPSLSRRALLIGGGAAALGQFCGAGHGLARSRQPGPAPHDPARSGILRYQGWAGRVMYPELAEALGYMAPLQLQWRGNISSGPQDLQALVTGETEFASAFNGAIMKMISVGAPMKAVFAYEGTNPGMCSGLLVPAQSPLRTARDLLGRTIGVNTLRAQSECFVYQYLRANGLTEREQEQITLVAIPAAVGEAALRHGRVDALVAADFFRDAALSRGGLRELARDVDYYGSSNLDSIALRESYMAAHPRDAAHFVAASARAIRWVQQNSAADVITLMKEIMKKRHRDESTLPLRYWSSCSIATKGGILLGEDFRRFQPWFASRGDGVTAGYAPGAFFTNTLNPWQNG